MRRIPINMTFPSATVLVIVLSVTSLHVCRVVAQENGPTPPVGNRYGKEATDSYTTALRLVIESRKALHAHPRRSLLLAVEAVETMRRAGRRVPPQVKEALIHALSATGGRVLTTPALAPGDGPVELPEESAAPIAPAAVIDEMGPVPVVDPSASPPITPRSQPNIPRPPTSPETSRKAPSTPRDAPPTQPDNLFGCVESNDAPSVNIARLDHVVTDNRGRWVAAYNREPDYDGSWPSDPIPLVYLWDLTSSQGDTAPQRIRAAERQVTAMAMSGNGKWLVIGADDGRLHFWKLKSPLPSQSDFVLGADGTITTGGAMPDSPESPSAGGAASAAVAESTNGPTDATAAGLAGAAFSRDDQWLVTAWQNGSVMLWKLTDQGPANSPAMILKESVNFEHPIFEFSRDGRWLVVANADSGSGLFDGLGEAIGNAFGSALGAMLGGGKPSEEGQAEREARKKKLREAARRFHLFRLDTSNISDSHIEMVAGEGPVCRVALSPDSHRIAGCTTDGTIRVWSLGTAGPVGEPRTFEQKGQTFLGGISVQAMAFGPQGQWLVSAGMHDVRIWNVDSATSSAQPAAIVGRIAAADRLQVDPHGNWFAFAGSTGRDIHIYNFALLRTILSGKCELLVPEPGVAVCESLSDAFAIVSPPGRELGATTLRGHSGDILTLHSSSDGHRLLSGSADGTVRIWPTNPSHPFAYPRFLPLSASMVAPPMSVQGNIAAVTSFDPMFLGDGPQDGGNLKIWRSPHNRNAVPVGELCVPGPMHWILAISNDNRRAVVQDLNGKVHLVDLKTGKTLESGIEIQGHPQGIGAAVFSPNGHWLATTKAHAMPPRPMKEDDVEPGPVLPPEPDPVVRLWNLAVEPIGQASVALKGHAQDVSVMLMSPDNRWLVTAACSEGGMFPGPPRANSSPSENSSICLWDLSSLPIEPTRIVLLEADVPAHVVRLSPDGRLLVASDNKGRVYLWDLTAPNPKQAQRVLVGHSLPVQTIAWGAGGNLLATGSGHTFPDPTGSRGGTVRLWDLRAKDPASTCIVLEGHRGSITSLAVSQDGRWVATADSLGFGVKTEGKARLWDLKAEDQSTAGVVLRAHEDTTVGRVLISPDSRWLVTVGTDEIPLMLWDLQDRNPPMSGVWLCPEPVPGELLAFEATFADGGRSLQTIGGDGLRTWTLELEELLALARATAGRELDESERRRFHIPR